MLPHRKAELHIFSSQEIISIIYTKYTKNKQATPQIYCNAVQIGKFTQLRSEIYMYHGTADYGLVPDLLEGLSVFCVCSLITGHPLCMLGRGELCIPFGERHPGIPGGWVTVIMSCQNHLVMARRRQLYFAFAIHAQAVPSFHARKDIPVYLAGKAL